MENKIKAKDLRNHFGEKPFHTSDLYDFFKNDDPGLKETTFRWRVHELKNDGVIYTLGKGIYSTISKKDFEPVMDKKMAVLYHRAKNQFPYTEMAVWDTSWLKSYMIHQAFSNVVILEVEREGAPAVFAFLQETYTDIYLNPKRFEMENYILPRPGGIILKNLNKTAPLTERQGLKVPKIEKIMVDLFVEEETFLPYQGAELRHLFQEFFRNFNINRSTLLQYANKRHAKEKLLLFLKNGMDIGEEWLT